MPRKPPAQHEDAAKKKAPPEAGVYPRFNAAKRAAKLDACRSRLAQCGFPIYIRYDDLEAAGIAKNWPTLTRLIEEEGFPRGVMLSPNIRAWRLDEIKAWLATRPVERKSVPTRWGGDRRATT
jgi:predicted DNA-binding transcriptional regulator AlpA